MRKYFLLSAVALMAATSANATTDYAEVTAKANIQVAKKITCTDVGFDNIVVKENNSAVTIQHDGGFPNGDVFSASFTRGRCYNGDPETGEMISDLDGFEFLTNDIELTATGGSEGVFLSVYTADDEILGNLEIPASVKAGAYEGHFTITKTY
ncbi:MAG: hypothetical protein E7016_03860 [Alphaproteobacteria bacterium]|nr:hypothetical protein [Alphaproteobacteria bacterium]